MQINEVPEVSQDLWVLVIGASAGGLRAIQEVLNRLTPDENLAVFVVQHLSPRYPSHLTSILKRTASMEVKEAVHQEMIKGGTIYVATPNHHLVLHDQRILLDGESEKVKFARPSIDVLFESAAQVYGSKTIGLILSGTGSDGSNGIISIKEHGGFTIAQESSNSCYNAMPQNAINTGAIDFVLPLNEIPRIISQIIKDTDSVNDELKLDEHLAIIELLRRNLNVDVLNYRRSTFKRRVRKRMTQLHMDTIQEYIDYLRSHPEEAEELHDDLLINVTHFLRDEGAFDSLRDNILSPLIEKIGNGETLRIWSVGCSTGEEPYSIAFIVADLLEQARKNIEVKIYATDLDEPAILEARRGIYNESKVRSMPEGYKDKYMIASGEFYKVKKQIRSWVIFGVQDITHSAPIAKVDVIVCRNMLIYFEKELQKKILTMFHYALNPGGYLFLGKSETTSILPEHFEAIDRRWKLYKSRPVLGHRIPFIRNRNTWLEQAPNEPQLNMRKVSEIVVENIPSPILVFNETLELILYNRRGQDMLQGMGLFDETGAVRAEHVALEIFNTAIQSEIKETITTGINMAPREITLPHKDIQRNYLLSIMLDNDEGRRAVLIALFMPLSRRSHTINYVINHPMDNIEKELEDAITLAEELQAANEELETTNEELQAANEELETTNEELEASNEELETTNEELEAANEELETINEELEVRTLELQSVSGLKNSVLSSINVAVIAVDMEGSILEWNPAASQLFDVPNYKALQRNLFSMPLPPEFGDMKLYLERLAAGHAEALNHIVTTWHKKTLHVDYVPLHNEELDVAGLLIVAYDITEQHALQLKIEAALSTERRLGEELMLAKADAERANHMKTEFIAELSHDLRSSLNVVLGMSQMGQERVRENRSDDEEFSKDVDEYFVITQRAAENLYNLLAQVLELSSIELGKKTIENKVFSANQLIDQISSVIAYKARRAQLQYFVQNDIEPRYMMEADFAKLCQVLINMLDNAIKYSQPEGTVRFQLIREGDFCVITVADQGMGMTPETLKRVFDPFYRGKEVKAVAGTGLGMAITHKLVSVLGGEIRVSSVLNEGTQVVVRVPVRFVQVPQDPVAPGGSMAASLREKLRDRHVLIIDSDNISQIILRRAMTALGMHVMAAMTIEDALVQATQQLPDLVLMEKECDDGEGSDFVDQWLARHGKRPPVLLVTSDIFHVGLNDEWRQYADELLGKPLTLDELHKRLWYIFQKEQEG
ncbi:CheR family methyltransferase [Heliophilum fasciatum]|uniref:Stage 0 sporulation protein A homolog n=1 Tax=Heliophilum fasciatum TaxID=35700 RepID=A0A4R2RTJ7_9FIRM|nr:CheR family methyltransferase [Heliophilum fasciatum]MCW2278794.1 two-component system CheB/CheR fusion protein [Heliophilum fasciatum]TCP62465.1 signal transduction histidine kinase [Heliophilum fasciatum]